MPTPDADLITPAITIFGSGFMAYLGVKVAIAELKGEIKRHEDRFKSVESELTSHGERLNRLERPHFE